MKHSVLAHVLKGEILIESSHMYPVYKLGIQLYNFSSMDVTIKYYSSNCAQGKLIWCYSFVVAFFWLACEMLKEWFKLFSLTVFELCTLPHWCISNLSSLMSLAGCAPLFLLLLLHLAFARPLFPLPSKTKNDDKKPIQTFRPYNIAHRGSNGEIPEETASAYLVLLRKLQALLICSRILYFYLAKGIRCFLWSWYA